jgi:hypothetical protein
MTEYVSASKRLEIEDYPMGGKKRGTATYYVHKDSKGRERVERTTTCRGKTSKPKKLTYGSDAAILVGSDGKTYPAVWSRIYDQITVMDSGMKFQHESVNRSHVQYENVVALFRGIK